MKLLQRIAVLLKADAHGMVESLEERSLLLKQYLREGEIELDRIRARLDTLRDELKALRDLRERQQEILRKLDEDVSLALEGEKEDLARFAIRQLLPHRREATDLAVQIEQREMQLALLAERVEEQERKYEELKTRARAETRDFRGFGTSPCCDPATVAEEEVEIELLRRRAGEVAR